MLFLHANVILVNPQIHTNVMRLLCVLIYFNFFEPLLIHVSDIVLFLKFLLGIHSLIKYVHIVNDRKYTETNNNVSLFFMALEI